MRPVLIAVAAAAALGCASRLTAADPQWVERLKTGPASPWKTVDKRWVVASAVGLDPEKPNRLKPTPAADGPVWVNGPGRLPDLVTKAKYGDCEAHVEFLIAKKSNAGVKFHAVYEVQILDSFGKPDTALTGDDCGGIYPRAELLPKYHHIDAGIAPRTNASKPAGEWQALDLVFRAPRFDEKGEKSANAVLVKAALNGTVVHENVELKTPTGNNWSKKEAPTGPFMLQADHGPVAFRNVKLRALDK